MTRATKTLIATACVIVAVATVIVQRVESGRLRAENGVLRHRGIQLLVMRAENERLLNDLARATNVQLSAENDRNELLRLRGEVVSLRSKTNDLAYRTQINSLRRQNEKLQERVAAKFPPPSLSSEDEVAIVCRYNLRKIDGAKQQFALEQGLGPADQVSLADVLRYLPRELTNSILHCPSGGTYTIGSLNEAPTCSIPGHELPH
jgi:hypothetical protein